MSATALAQLNKDQKLAIEIGDYYHYPLGFVLFDFSSEVPGPVRGLDDWTFERKCQSKHMVDRLNPQPA